MYGFSYVGQFLNFFITVSYQFKNFALFWEYVTNNIRIPKTSIIVDKIDIIVSQYTINELFKAITTEVFCYLNAFKVAENQSRIINTVVRCLDDDFLERFCKPYCYLKELLIILDDFICNEFICIYNYN